MPGARPSGMGGAFVGVVDDAHAVAWNPAGMGLIRRDAAYLTRYGFAGTSVESLGWTRPWRTGGVGARADFFHGALDASKIGAAASTRVSHPVHLGGALNLERASQPGRSDTALLFDAGLLAALMPGVTLGMAAHNFGTSELLGKPPENIRIGFGVRFARTQFDWLRGLLAGFEIDYARLRKAGGVSLGGEYRWRDWAARLGLSGGSVVQTEGKTIALGFGWRKNGFGADLTFAPPHKKGDSLRLGLTYEWGFLQDRPAADYLLDMSSEEAAEEEPVPLGVHMVERRFARAEERLREGHPKMASLELDKVRRILDDGDVRVLRYYETQGRALLALQDWVGARRVYVDGARIARALKAKKPREAILTNPKK
ncbi:MAG: hypothetical protein HY925_14960, partial [Elusimicrobia bacterium]|nr:hypothetical protein [Elusimicrobiota bacterium]